MAYTTRFGQLDDYRRDELIRKIEHSFDVKSENNVKNVIFLWDFVPKM